jgi:hypothetical protein
MAPDHGLFVNHFELVSVCGNVHRVTRHDCHHRKQGTFRLPALAAAADVVVGGLTRYGDGDRVISAFADQRSAAESLFGFGESFVD